MWVDKRAEQSVKKSILAEKHPDKKPEYRICEVKHIRLQRYVPGRTRFETPRREWTEVTESRINYLPDVFKRALLLVLRKGGIIRWNAGTSKSGLVIKS